MQRQVSNLLNRTSKRIIGNMGSVFGKETVAEPHFDILLERPNTSGLRNPNVSYEIRKYGERFAAETTYDADSTDSGFMTLAKYIGVFGKPENEGSTSISMTAPVVIQQPNENDNNDFDSLSQEEEQGGTKISMTAPVVIEQDDSSDGSSNTKTMKFMLPAEYDSMDKIPKPTNPAVVIEEIPPAVGAVHRYHGSMSDSRNYEMAQELAHQLQKDGLVDVSTDQFQFWGYNPPFTLPMFRRNEVWIELSQEQVNQLLQKFEPN